MLDSNLRMVAESREALHQIIVDLLTWRGIVDDEPFLCKVTPFHFISPGKVVVCWKYGEHALRPERLSFTVRPITLSRYEGGFQPKLTNGANMISRIVVDKVDLNLGVAIRVATKQLREKARCDGGIDANPDAAMLRASHRGNVLHAMADVPQHLSRTPQKALTREGQADAAAVTMEQRRAEMIFQISDATAKSGLLNADGSSSLAEAAMFGRRNEIAEMTELNGMGQLPHDIGALVFLSEQDRQASSGS